MTSVNLFLYSRSECSEVDIMAFTMNALVGQVADKIANKTAGHRCFKAASMMTCLITLLIESWPCASFS